MCRSFFCVLFIENKKESTEKNDENGTLTFDAEKWRAGDGASYFLDCTAKQNKDGTYADFEIGAFAAA